MSELFWPGSKIVEHGPRNKTQGLKDVVVDEHTIGGPLDPRDVRMYLDKKTLTHLLQVASTSVGGVVELPRVGLKVKTWQTDQGHNYQTITIVSGQPRAAKTPLG